MYQGILQVIAIVDGTEIHQPVVEPVSVPMIDELTFGRPDDMAMNQRGRSVLLPAGLTCVYRVAVTSLQPNGVFIEYRHGCGVVVEYYGMASDADPISCDDDGVPDGSDWLPLYQDFHCKTVTHHVHLSNGVM